MYAVLLFSLSSAVFRWCLVVGIYRIAKFGVSSCVVSFSPGPHWLLYEKSVGMENVRLDIAVIAPQTKTKIQNTTFKTMF